MPMTNSTASQWPPSITVSIACGKPNMLLTATVVATKPSQTKAAETMPFQTVDLARSEMREEAGEHPGHDRSRRRRRARRAARRPACPCARRASRLEVLHRLAVRVDPVLRERHVPGRADHPADERGDENGEIVHSGECHGRLPKRIFATKEYPTTASEVLAEAALHNPALPAGETILRCRMPAVG